MTDQPVDVVVRTDEEPLDVVINGRRSRWRTYVVAGLVVLAVPAAVWAGLDRIAKNAETTKALCALRADVERRVASSEKFLKDNPEGIPGIPAETIRSGIVNQRSTVDALSDLSC